MTPRSKLIGDKAVNRKAQLEQLGESGRLGLNKIIIKRAANALNSPIWKETEIYYLDKV